MARGFEDDLQGERMDSPSCLKESLHITMLLITSKGWKCETVDVKAAFLQGHSINRDLFVSPPREFCNGCLWKLKKVVYGLCDAARAWYFRVKEFLVSAGMIVSSFDQALFYWYDMGHLSGIVCIHVDDLCYGGTESFLNGVMDNFSGEFLIGSSSYGDTFNYIGMSVEQDKGKIILSQSTYIEH